MTLLEELKIIAEARGLIKNVVRDGVIKQVLDCPEGFKASKGKCVRMTQQEVMKRQRAAKIAIRTRSRNAAKNRMTSAKSRIRSERIRKMKAGVLAKTKVGG